MGFATVSDVDAVAFGDPDDRIILEARDGILVVKAVGLVSREAARQHNKTTFARQMRNALAALPTPTKGDG